MWTEKQKNSNLQTMSTRISTDLADPRLVKLLKAEAIERDTTVKEVLTRALEAYFADRLESKALAKLAESSFSEWDDPRDADYDKL
jgi:hypothetical protein